MNAVLTWGRQSYQRLDPKISACFSLLVFNVLGLTVLGFNRSPGQVLLTCLATVGLQLFYDYLFYKITKPSFSAFITSLGLSLLVNFGHSYWYPLVPVFFAISTKYVFTLKGRHVFNPALMGVALSLLVTNEFISAAPAYQWNEISSMPLIMAGFAMFLFMPKINRHWLVISWLGTFTLQIIFRSLLIKHYLPWQTLFFGTLSSPAFFLFTFFMITDPATSPKTKREQIIAGISLGVLDLFFHLLSSYHTFFYAAMTFGSYRLLTGHFKELRAEAGPLGYIKTRLFESGHYKKVMAVVAVALIGLFSYKMGLNNTLSTFKPQFSFEQIAPEKTGFNFGPGDLIENVDPRVQHMGKWILAITDGVAVADVNNDGLMDIFFNNPFKKPEERNALFINKGDFDFEREPQSELSHFGQNLKKYGVPSNGMFLDFDQDGDKDLFVSFAFGKDGTSRLFKNMFIEEGRVRFTHITDDVGLKRFSNSATANAFDFNGDGLLDIIVGNTIATHLPDYKTATPLNLFDLPKPEYEGDRRMFNFMHESWHMANNGGLNYIYLQKLKEDGSPYFEELNPTSLGMPETRWSMALGTADFNRDGLTDLYVANDFGADDLYLNKDGKSFENIKGSFFGTIGRDTYKGMNATIGDFDENGYQDVYISNVHQALQAEGSLLWTFHRGKENFRPEIVESATAFGALNENRFGWGAAAVDFNNDGHLDLAQANGMVDNVFDGKFKPEDESCPDYWYINEKLARSPPEIHRYIDNWGDIRGKCIHGKEKNRLYVNQGPGKKPQFIDVANKIGMDQVGNWRGMAAADFNNDGKIDLVASSLFRNPLVFKNKATHGRNWIGFSLESEDSLCNREGAGSLVTLNILSKGKIKSFVREKVIVNGFSAQSDSRIHFGVGEGELSSVIVNWCGKKRVEYKNLKENLYHNLKLSKGSIAKANSEKHYMALFSYDHSLIPGWSPHSFAYFYDEKGKSFTISWLPKSGPEDVEVFSSAVEGKNYSLQETFEFANKEKKTVSFSGKFEIKKDLFDQAYLFKSELEKGEIKYQVFKNIREGQSRSLHCVHALSDLLNDQTEKKFEAGWSFAESANEKLVDFFSPYIVKNLPRGSWKEFYGKRKVANIKE
ncbi:MAG: FG-GAP-like repeat-containing protein [Halobacteriovoraceae bacterium]|nr:FG-GAP-like repeat-containing protein [Halobacteriovoraceae bacterium]